jgi:hypothetical protein
MEDELSPSAAQTLEHIRAILTASRAQALRAVNTAMLQAYWEIGREIVEEEQRGAERAEYGARLLETLSRQLTQEFGKGFTVPTWEGKSPQLQLAALAK